MTDVSCHCPLSLEVVRSRLGVRQRTHLEKIGEEHCTRHIRGDEVTRRLVGYTHGYQKSRNGMFTATQEALDVAYANAQRLRARLERPGDNPSTDVDVLVRLLCTLCDTVAE